MDPMSWIRDDGDDGDSTGDHSENWDHWDRDLEFIQACTIYVQLWTLALINGNIYIYIYMYNVSYKTF